MGLYLGVTYFYHLQVGDYTETRKLVMLNWLWQNETSLTDRRNLMVTLPIENERLIDNH